MPGTFVLRTFVQHDVEYGRIHAFQVRSRQLPEVAHGSLRALIYDTVNRFHHRALKGHESAFYS